MTLTELLTEYAIPHRLPGADHHVSTGWLGCECPYCGHGSGKFHLGLRVDRPVASCYKCGTHRYGDTLAELTGLPAAQVLRLLDFRSDFTRTPTRPTGKLKLPSHLGPLKPVHRRYLAQRGFDPEEIVSRWGVQGIGLHPRLGWHLFIPITLHGETVSWTTRSLSAQGKRYVTASTSEEKLPAKSLLYGIDHIEHIAIIVEGPTDVWRIGPGAVATLGVQYTPSQVARLAQIPSRVICYDCEPQAQRQARKLADELSLFPGCTHVVELEAEDPGSASEREIRQLRRKFLKS